MLSEEKIREILDQFITYKEQRENELKDSLSESYKKYVLKEIKAVERDIRLLKQIINGQP